ncbi:MAG TPA: alkaline shock response membrane anchor protein AmaP [Bacillota bacterium]
MKIGDRFLNLLNAIVLFILGMILVTVVWRSDWIVDKLVAFTDKERFWVLVVGIVTMILAFLSFSRALQRRREEKTIIHQTQFGEVQIAVSAVESLSLRAAKRIKGVKDAHVGVRADSTGLDVFIEVTVNPDLSIPQISEEIRINVDEYLQETVGIHVNSVKVLVTKIAGEAVKARVE